MASHYFGIVGFFGGIFEGGCTNTDKQNYVRNLNCCHLAIVKRLQKLKKTKNIFSENGEIKSYSLVCFLHSHIISKQKIKSFIVDFHCLKGSSGHSRNKLKLTLKVGYNFCIQPKMLWHQRETLPLLMSLNSWLSQ